MAAAAAAAAAHSVVVDLLGELIGRLRELRDVVVVGAVDVAGLVGLKGAEVEDEHVPLRAAAALRCRRHRRIHRAAVGVAAERID
jgi:hypothetical protein